MKLFKRKTATLQDYINFTGVVLFIWVIATRTVLIGGIDNLFVIDNALALITIGVFIEMFFVNLSIFITDFKNWSYDAGIKRKYGRGKDDDKKES